MSHPVPGTSAARGKRMKTHSCRVCDREWRHVVRAKRDGRRSKLGKQLRFHCNGKWDT